MWISQYTAVKHTDHSAHAMRIQIAESGLGWDQLFVVTLPIEKGP